MLERLVIHFLSITIISALIKSIFNESEANKLISTSLEILHFL